MIEMSQESDIRITKDQRTQLDAAYGKEDYLTVVNEVARAAGYTRTIWRNRFGRLVVGDGYEWVSFSVVET